MNALPIFNPIFTGPAFPSPLAPRSINTLPPAAAPNAINNMTPPKPLFRLQTTPDTPSTGPQPHRSEPHARPFRQSLNTRVSPRPSLNPLTRNQTPSQTQSQTRDAFLDKVLQQRQDSRWNTRSEQILQMDYIAQRRAWEAEQARLAPAFDPEELEPEMDEREDGICQSQHGPVSSSQPPWLAASLSQDSRIGTGVDQSEQQMQLSQLSHGAYTGNPPVLTQTEQEEIDAYLEAEAREMEALIALHEAEAASPSYPPQSWEELPEARPEQTNNENIQPSEMPLSSPVWGSDDPDFEEELSKLSGDAMDVSVE